MKNSFLVGLFSLLTFASLPAQQDGAVLRPGDQIVIRLGGVPAEDAGQVSGNHTVDGQGFINLPYIGKVQAAGLTQSALQASIESTYRGQEIYSNPVITINTESGNRFVNVGGDVKGPKRVPFTPDLTVLSAITACGGFTEYADQKKIRLLRDGKAVIIDVKAIRKDPTRDVGLKPGDSIEVPRGFW